MVSTESFKSGKVKSFDFTYEHLEAKVASFYLTFLHYRESAVHAERMMFERLVEELDVFARRHGIQKPQDAIVNVRAKKPEHHPRKINSDEEVMQAIFYFQMVFGAFLRKKEDEDFLIQVHEICCHHLATQAA
jgi:hypothetical protein